MERKDIYIQTSDGFLKDVKYTAGLLEFLAEYKDRFGRAKSLEVYIKEIPYTMLKYSLEKREEPIQITDDGNKIVIKYPTHKYYDIKGKVTGVPTQQDIYNGLRFVLEKAANKYLERFPQNVNE